jgi:hypothetical protein
MRKSVRSFSYLAEILVALAWLVPVHGMAAPAKKMTLSAAQVKIIMRRSYQYVAMQNVNNKFALGQGWLITRSS